MVEVWVNAQNGNDVNPGTKELPVKSIKTGLSKISGDGDLVHIEGTFYSGLKLNQILCKKPLIIDGEDKTMIWGFEGEKHEFEIKDMPHGTWNNVTICDCHNLVVKNMDVWGGANQSVELNDSYPNVGLRNVTLDGIRVKYGPSRGIFMGGKNIEGISILNSKVSQTIYGDTTHGIYLSGGHWADSNPVKDVRIENCLVEYTGGRHCVQLNGRFQDVKIKNNILKHGQIAGLSLIGCRDVHVTQNEMWGHNRGWGVVIYDYIDPNYWNIMDPQEKEAWLSCHHASRNIYIYNNTMCVGPHQFSKDQWHPNDSPEGRPTIAINNNVKDVIPSYQMFNIVVARNVMWSPWGHMIGFSHNHEAVVTTVKENIVWCADNANPWTIPGVSVPYGDKYYFFNWLDENVKNWYADNVITDPKFEQIPEYDFVDRDLNPYYNWDDHKSSANLKSEVATQYGRGKDYSGTNPWEG